MLFCLNNSIADVKVIFLQKKETNFEKLPKTKFSLFYLEVTYYFMPLYTHSQIVALNIYPWLLQHPIIEVSEPN